MVEAATWDEYIECVRRYLASGRINKDELHTRNCSESGPEPVLPCGMPVALRPDAVSPAG